MQKKPELWDVTGWVEGVIEGWFPGYTDPSDSYPGQYRVVCEGDNVYRLETPYRESIGRYKINVSVEEIE